MKEGHIDRGATKVWDTLGFERQEGIGNVQET